MLVNTKVPIFHAQNLFQILKKEKARIKFMNFSQKYIGSVLFWGVTLYIDVKKVLNLTQKEDPELKIIVVAANCHLSLNWKKHL